MHAALAALYWSKGQEQQAEEQWQYTCVEISVRGRLGEVQHCTTVTVRMRGDLGTL